MFNPTSKRHAWAVRGARWGLLLLMCGFVLLSVAVDAKAQDAEPQRAETMEFDPSTGQWTEVLPPVPGTPEGDLRLARAEHARGEHKQTVKAIKNWFKTYGDMDPLRPEAVLLRSHARIALKDYYKTYKELQEFLSEFSGTNYENEALNMQFVIAEVFLSGTKRKFLGMRILRADDIGLRILDDIVANDPDSQLAELATVTKARYYFAEGDYAFAEQEYGFLIQQYPRSRYVRQSLLQGAYAAQASFTGIDFDDAPLIEAEERFRRYVSLYPGSAEQEGIGLLLDGISETRAEKELSIGKYYEKVGRLKAARFYYRSTQTNWPDTVAAIGATERLQALVGVESPEDVETTSPPADDFSPTNDPASDETIKDAIEQRPSAARMSQVPGDQVAMLEMYPQ
ncbi:MAG TPA: outer membrane protein assembly factor BamD [Phycisphaerae bacterium]|nr:outer membrane protein assembly factor BamD [Phycisphaerae bacterium]